MPEARRFQIAEVPWKRIRQAREPTPPPFASTEWSITGDQSACAREVRPRSAWDRAL